MILPSKNRRRIERWNVWDYPKGLNCMLYDYEKVAQEERGTRKCVIGWMVVRVRFLPLSFIWIFPKKKCFFFTLSGKAFTFLVQFHKCRERDWSASCFQFDDVYFLMKKMKWKLTEVSQCHKIFRLIFRKKVGEKWRVKWTSCFYITVLK